jgi:capsule biosynthesis phosphatase
MRICIDLDGVICRLRRPGESYENLEPVEGALEKLRQLKASGHYIIIATARHMKTCEGNLGKVLARQGAVTLNWLAKYRVEYDEIHFGKPHAQVYIDDNAFRFTSWNEIAGDGRNLSMSAEEQLALKEHDSKVPVS